MMNVFLFVFCVLTVAAATKIWRCATDASSSSSRWWAWISTRLHI